MKNSFKQVIRKVAVAGAFGTLALGFVLPTSAFAAGSGQGTKCAATDVKCVITAGDKLIADRETALGKLADKINDLHNKHSITDTESSDLLGNVNGNEAALTTLKTKLDAETSAKLAREDVRDIFMNYRIFAVVLPRDAHRLHLDVERTLHDKLKDIEPKLQDTIQKAKGDDKTKLQNFFNDYQKDVNDAENQIDLAQSDLPSLTVDIFNHDHGIYVARLNALKQAEARAHKDLHEAAQDLHQAAELAKKDKI